MEVTTRDLEAALLRLSRRARWVCFAFRVLAVMILLFWVAFTLLARTSVFGLTWQLEDASSILPSIAQGILVAILLWSMGDVFGEIAYGHTVFSELQVKRMRVASFSMLIYLIMDSFVCPWSASLLSPDGIFATYDNVGVGANINLGLVLLVVVLFGVTSVFRYGVLLQGLSDDTV